MKFVHTGFFIRLGLLLTVALACYSATAQQPPGGAADASAAKPETSFDCLIEPQVTVKLATPTAGVLKQVLVDRGDKVTKGELVAQLESGVEEAALRLAQLKAKNDATVGAKQTRLDFLKRKRDRFADVHSHGAMAEQTFDEADTDYQTALNDLRQAQFDLEASKLDADRAAEVVNQRYIHSPLNGVVVERSLWNGEYAYEQAPIMTLAQTDPLKVEVFLPVSYYHDVTPGMKIKVFPAAPVRGEYTASVDVIDTVFDSRSGTFGVRLQLPNPDSKLPAGVRCKAQFNFPQRP
jgi:RND family efflux transporter MFP subunit